MKIVVDADSCPKNVRAIILKASKRIKREVFFIADRPLQDCVGKLVTMIVVDPGPDEADHRVVEEVNSGDLVITRDVILASRVVDKGCIAIDDRGGIFTRENMAERLSIRNMMTEFREAGLHFERTRPLSGKETQAFANKLDATVTRLIREETDET